MIDFDDGVTFYTHVETAQREFQSSVEDKDVKNMFYLLSQNNQIGQKIPFRREGSKPSTTI